MGRPYLDILIPHLPYIDVAPAGPDKGVRTEATREKYSPLLREANTVKDFATAQQWYKMESVPVYIHELMIYSFREQI